VKLTLKVTNYFIPSEKVEVTEDSYMRRHLGGDFNTEDK